VLQLRFRKAQGVDFELSQFWLHLAGEKLERIEHLFLSELAKSKFAQKSVSAGLAGDLLDLIGNCFG